MTMVLYKFCESFRWSRIERMSFFTSSNFQQSDDRSTFICIAHNEGGETQVRLTVYAYGNDFCRRRNTIHAFIWIERPHIAIYPTVVTYSHYWNVTLTCVDTAGIPRPQLVWRRQNERQPIAPSSTVLIHDGILTMFMTTKADEGIDRSFIDRITWDDANQQIQFRVNKFLKFD